MSSKRTAPQLQPPVRGRDDSGTEPIIAPLCRGGPEPHIGVEVVCQAVGPDYFGRSPAQRATLCYMRTVTHREMRNQSGAILRHVADGETIQVTNNGQVAALIVPPGTDPLADLVSRGQVRVARNSTSSLRSIVRRKGTADSQAIVADVRGRW